MLRRSFLFAAASAPALAAPFRIATFRADVTPPIGSAIYTGFAKSIVDPLEARGVVLHGTGRPIVIVSLEWCEVRNRSYDLWRAQLAKAAGTTAERVLLSCVHPHDAPYTDFDAQALLDEVKSPHKLCDAAFERAAIAKVAAAIRSARTQTVNAVATSKATVEQVASNRRYVLPNGKVSFGRTSATRDAGVRNQPEGLIDPLLRTVSFWNGSKPVAALHSYSTHPMSYYGSGDVTPDFPVLAMRKLQAESSDCFHIYFSGASGDTMAGRYNDGNTKNRVVLADRMYAGMKASWAASKPEALNSVGFRNAKLVFEPRKDAAYTMEAMRRVLHADSPRRERLDAALGISWLQRLGRKVPIDVPAVQLGPASIVLVPAEAFVQYQLWAQEAAPQRMVMTLGYSECAPGYIPTNAAIGEGYDDHYSWVDFGTCEGALRRAVVEALA